ncbi:tyrosine--tRNA ligase [Parasphingorhabdus sp. JC815]|uniref:tyrosine--tRNA ligase n=1 Tax=Parasphingorhabdus sp. JC815 TaxID=3232140 RepID=UPI00345935C5
MNFDENPLEQFQAKSPVMQMLIQRGYVNQATNITDVDEAFDTGIVTAYVGFDATADSLHVGHLLPIMSLRRLQQAGHKPIVLVGGGTTRIGDPSFRSEVRPMLTDEQIASNIAGIKKVFERFLVFGDGPTDAILVNNADWLDQIGWIDMLRDVGQHFSVNRMLSFDSVKSRLDRQENLSFLEFNYMILQAYDFLELSRRYGCVLQMGGADQWGNIVNGIDLTRRVEGRKVFGMTAPLLTTASGTKMGKTASGAVWLNADRLSPYDYWQFWRNVDDADVGKFLRLFTDIPEDEILQLEGLQGAQLNAAKIRLAKEATALAHGVEAARASEETARQTFERGQAADGLPTFELTDEERASGVRIVDLLVRTTLAKSKGEARRAIAARSVRIDGAVMDEDQATIAESSLPLRLSVGRKRHAVVK